MIHDAAFLGRGWRFPVSFNAADASVFMTSDVRNIAESIDLLLSTLRGSRALLPEFGGQLSRFLHRRIDAQALEAIATAVRFALLHGEPRIVVEDVRAEKSVDGSRIDLVIAYRIGETNSRHNHVHPFAGIEGSLLAPLPKRDGG
jgi:uncharacterized protein